MNDAKRAVPYAERNFQPAALSIEFFIGFFLQKKFISSEYIKSIIGLFSYIGNIKDCSRKKELGFGCWPFIRWMSQNYEPNKKS